MGDQIHWINHAGYEIRADGRRLLHDPWLKGLAFADGWDVVSATAPVSFAGIDYIWISHEHPDHFSPASLKAIPAELRGGITILYQQTRDGRVRDFCRKLGFIVRELPNGRRVDLGDGLAITSGVIAADSWSFLETRQTTYFNANDCFAANWRKVAASLGKPVDVLLAQFSYANWVGDPGENHLMARHAADKIREMEEQIDALQPRILIPFASYVWFCRDDNFHLNEEANRIDKVLNHFRDRIQTVVLYPDDVYDVGAFFDSDSAVTRYLADWATHDRPLTLPEESTSLTELESLSRGHQESLRKQNIIWPLRLLAVIGYLRPVRVYLRDLDLGLKYSMFGGILAAGLERGACDMEFSSASFAAMLRNGYGFSTLAVNGRFRQLSADGFAALSKHFAIAAENERGFSFPSTFLQSHDLGPHLRRAMATLASRIDVFPGARRAAKAAAAGR